MIRSPFQLCLVQVTISSEPQQQSLLLENKLKGLSYVALPRLFTVCYYFRPGSDGVGAGNPERGVGVQKSISPSRKTEKAFRLSSSCRPCSYAQCLCLPNFPIISSVFLFFMFFFHILGGTEFDQRLHLPSDVCEQMAFFQASQTVVSH